jgi:hypothetical protein
MREAGKGDTYRPTNKKAFDENYDRIFGRPVDDSTPKDESIWSEQYVRENPKLAADCIATLQTLLDDRDETIKNYIIGEK